MAYQAVVVYTRVFLGTFLTKKPYKPSTSSIGFSNLLRSVRLDPLDVSGFVCGQVLICNVVIML